MGVDLRLSAGVAGVRRTHAGVEVRCAGGEWEAFDEVVMATHSDQSLALLSDASPQEKSALSDIRYQPNQAVLHADTSVMPRRKAAWASWVYSEAAGQPRDRIDLTYWMNSLQPIPQDDPMFVTLNGTRAIQPELIYDEVSFRTRSMISRRCGRRPRSRGSTARTAPGSAGPGWVMVSTRTGLPAQSTWRRR